MKKSILKKEAVKHTFYYKLKSFNMKKIDLGDKEHENVIETFVKKYNIARKIIVDGDIYYISDLDIYCISFGLLQSFQLRDGAIKIRGDTVVYIQIDKNGDFVEFDSHNIRVPFMSLKFERLGITEENENGFMDFYINDNNSFKGFMDTIRTWEDDVDHFSRIFGRFSHEVLDSLKYIDFSTVVYGLLSSKKQEIIRKNNDGLRIINFMNSLYYVRLEDTIKIFTEEEWSGLGLEPNMCYDLSKEQVMHMIMKS